MKPNAGWHQILETKLYSDYPAELRIAQLGESVLKTKAQPVNEFGQELSSFVDKLLSKMHEAGGIGIAAPQVFCARQIMIIASRSNKRYPHAPDMAPLVMINPKIETQSEHLVKDWEGCLSVPGIRGMVPRPNWVEVSWLGLQGQQQRRRFEEFLARIFLHEFDHLIGRTWLDSVETNADIVSESVYLSDMTSE